MAPVSAPKNIWVPAMATCCPNFRARARARLFDVIPGQTLRSGLARNRLDLRHYGFFWTIARAVGLKKAMNIYQ